MILDIIFGLLILAAFYNGYTKGILYSVLSLVAIVIGIILAMNFSTAASIWLHNNFNIPKMIMPVLSFILIVLAVVGAIKLVAYLVEKFLKVLMLNFVNKIAGGLLWSFIATVLFSVLVFFVDKAGFLADNLVLSSQSYNYVVPLGPKSLELIQTTIPLLKESFNLLNETVNEIAPIK
jgi:membrane protein required for colicin V production